MLNNPQKNHLFFSLPKFLCLIAFFIVAFSVSWNQTEVHALDEAGITPYVVVECDLYKGCLIDSYDLTVEFDMIQFFQRDYTGTLKGGCNESIALSGCAITSAAMIVTEFMESLTNQETPVEVNAAMTNTCVFNPSEYGNKYSSVLTYLSSLTKMNTYTSLSTVSTYVAPHINVDSLAILGGYNSDISHFVVVNGYIAHYDIYENVTIIKYTDLEIVDPSTANRDKLSNFLALYPTVYRIWFFADKV